jgi:transcriptional regulator with XRE-family HTH domain
MDSVIDLEQLKKARGLRSLSEVAKAIGLTRQQVWNYEKGVSEPPISVLFKLSTLYGVRVERLLNQKNLTETSNGT